MYKWAQRNPFLTRNKIYKYQETNGDLHQELDKIKINLMWDIS